MRESSVSLPRRSHKIGKQRRSVRSNRDRLDVVIDSVSGKEPDDLGQAVGSDEQRGLRDVSDPLTPDKPRIRVLLPVPSIRTSEDEVLSPAHGPRVAAIDVPGDNERGSTEPCLALADEPHHRFASHRSHNLVRSEGDFRLLLGGHRDYSDTFLVGGPKVLRSSRGKRFIWNSGVREDRGAVG